MRYALVLKDYYGNISNLLKENKIYIDVNELELYISEIATKHPDKIFDYVINRLHLNQTLNMFEICIPLEYKGYTLVFSYINDTYIGNIQGTEETIEGKTIQIILDNFHNTVDYILN